MQHLKQLQTLIALVALALTPTTAHAVNPQRTPTISPNNLMGSTDPLYDTHTEQGQHLALTFKQLLTASGGVIERSAGRHTASTAWSRTSNVVTVTVPSGHGFIAGDSVTFDTVTAGADQLTAVIVSSAGATTILFPQTAADSSATEAGTIAKSGALDVLTAGPDFVWGLAGAGWWYVVRFDNLGGGTVRFLWEANDNTAPFQAIQHRGGNATWTGGHVSALPTVATGFAYGNAGQTAFHPYTDARNVRYSSWRTTNSAGAQSIRWMVKESGVNSAALVIDIEGNTGASGGGIGNERWWIYSASTSGPFDEGSFESATVFNSLNSGGSATAGTRAAASLWDLGSAWTSGLDVNGRENLQPMVIGQTPAAGRVLGFWVDVWAIPQNSGWGTWADSSESAQTYQRKNFDDCALFWPAGLDIL
jgi:hypothetical protein